MCGGRGRKHKISVAKNVVIVRVTIIPASLPYASTIDPIENENII